MLPISKTAMKLRLYFKVLAALEKYARVLQLTALNHM